MDIIAILAKIAPLFLAIAMFGMGLSMKVSDFKYLFTQSKPVLIGLALQVLFLPILAFCLAWIFALDPTLSIGLMLLAACPGGPGSNLVSYLSKGDIALSIALTSFSSILAIVSVPFITIFSLSYFQQQNVTSFSIAHLIAIILIVTLVPISAGIFTGRKAPNFAAKCENLVKVLTLIFILLLVIATILKEIETIETMISTLGLPLAVFGLTAVAVSFLITRLFQCSKQHQRTIAIEAGIQNPVLSVVVAGTFLQSAELAIPAAVYPVIMLTISLIFIASAQLMRPNESAVLGRLHIE